jgi:hypothetical protein
MQGQDARATWNLFRLNWLLIAAMSNVLALGVWLTDFDLAPHGYLIAFGFVDVIAGIAVAAFCIYAARYLDLAVAGRTARCDPPPTVRKQAGCHDQVTPDFS